MTTVARSVYIYIRMYKARTIKVKYDKCLERGILTLLLLRVQEAYTHLVLYT